jgi:hypothetical protein
VSVVGIASRSIDGETQRLLTGGREHRRNCFVQHVADILNYKRMFSSKEIGLELKADKTKYMVMSRD